MSLDVNVFDSLKAKLLIDSYTALLIDFIFLKWTLFSYYI
ncbi:hypothetical protein CZ797_16470 [Pseudoalteromonas sp. JB197]|nr:hypothetical protein CZ797_16470 [Pseudoalteromonas sp. JB197]